MSVPSVNPRTASFLPSLTTIASALLVTALACVGCSPSSAPAAPPSAGSPPTAPVATIESPDQATPATAESLSWLSLVDNSQYAESWDHASSSFKRAVDQSTWIKTATGVRGPLGKLVTRAPKAAQHLTTLPGGPDGDYFVLKFDTSFDHKKAAVETIAMMKDSDGKWHVAGYFIK
jgi:hypothetical protein